MAKKGRGHGFIGRKSLILEAWISGVADWFGVAGVRSFRRRVQSILVLRCATVGTRGEPLLKSIGGDHPPANDGGAVFLRGIERRHSDNAASIFHIDDFC